jgi:succinate-acetate transporter protein
MPRMTIEAQAHRIRDRKDGETFQSTIRLTGVTGFNPKVLKPLLRQLGNSAPLELSGFALTTLVLSLVNIQARDITNPHIAIGLGIYPFI